MLLPKEQIYVAFMFSPAFIDESKLKEAHLVEEKKTTDLEPGTLARVLEQYKEVAVDNRELSTLQVPKGALYFWFYDRLTITVPWRNRLMTLRSNDDERFNETGRFFLENEGVWFNRFWLEGTTEYPDLPLWKRKQLIDLMKKYKHGDATRIFQIRDGWESEQNFVLDANDLLIRPNQVQMVDTDIPWPNKK